MKNILPTVQTATPLTPLPPLRERFLAHHHDSINAGPSGPLVLFLASVSSTCVLLWSGCIFVYNRIRGYA